MPYLIYTRKKANSLLGNTLTAAKTKMLPMEQGTTRYLLLQFLLHVLFPTFAAFGAWTLEEIEPVQQCTKEFVRSS